jgi:aconitase B
VDFKNLFYNYQEIAGSQKIPTRKFGNIVLNSYLCAIKISAMERSITAMPDDMDYAHIVDGVLQISPDIEEEIAEVERGEVVSMSEFQTMFAKWLD